MDGTRTEEQAAAPSHLAERLRDVVGRFRENVVYTAPEHWGKRIEQLRESLDAIAAGFTESEDWGVAYGGEEPNECAGVWVGDEADARETVQWIRDGMLARRVVLTSKWEEVLSDDEDSS
jgi:hypothetical protein